MTQTTPREVAPEVASEAASAAASDATSEAATHVASEAVEDGAASEAPAVPGTATEGANDATLLSRAVCDGDMRRFECSICLFRGGSCIISGSQPILKATVFFGRGLHFRAGILVARRQRVLAVFTVLQ